MVYPCTGPRPFPSQQNFLVGDSQPALAWPQTFKTPPVWNPSEVGCGGVLTRLAGLSQHDHTLGFQNLSPPHLSVHKHSQLLVTERVLGSLQVIWQVVKKGLMGCVAP